jgi:hypothetical protein
VLNLVLIFAMGFLALFSRQTGPLGAKLQFDDIWAILKVKTFPAMVGPWLMRVVSQPFSWLSRKAKRTPELDIQLSAKRTFYGYAPQRPKITR